MNKKKPILNIANMLSISRIFSVIPLIFFLNNINFPNYTLYSACVIIYIVISDVLDGYFARKSNIVTDFGKIIDPVADKMCLIVVLIYLIDIYHAPFLIFFLLLSIRDIILITYSIYLIIRHNYVSQANFYGKLFIFNVVVMLVSFLYKFNVVFCYIMYTCAVFMLLLSTIKYIQEHKLKIKEYESI